MLLIFEESMIPTIKRGSNRKGDLLVKNRSQCLDDNLGVVLMAGGVWKEGSGAGLFALPSGELITWASVGRPYLGTVV